MIIGTFLFILSFFLSLLFVRICPKHPEIINDKYYRESREIYFAFIIGCLSTTGIIFIIIDV